MNTVLTKSLTVFKAFMLPFWQSDQNTLEDLSRGNPKLKIDVLFKDRDRLVDVALATDKGESKFEDIAASFNIFDGALRNLRFDTFGSFLVNNNLLGEHF